MVTLAQRGAEQEERSYMLAPYTQLIYDYFKMHCNLFRCDEGADTAQQYLEEALLEVQRRRAEFDCQGDVAAALAIVVAEIKFGVDESHAIARAINIVEFAYRVPRWKGLWYSPRRSRREYETELRRLIPLWGEI